MKIVLVIGLFLLGCSSDDKSDPDPIDLNNMANDVSQDDGVSDMGSSDVSNDLNDTDTGQASDPLFDIGEFSVGYQELVVTYDVPGSVEPREIPVKVWYPANAVGEDNFVQYRVAGLVRLDSEVAYDAPDPLDGPFPVLVYSHGSGGEGLLAYPYAEHFASHGWFVIAPNHVGNTALDAIGNSLLSFGEVTLYRVLDITAILDALEQGISADLAGRADLENVMLFGHSFGAYTTFAAGGADVDFDAFLNGCGSFGQETCTFLGDPDVEAAFRDGFGDERIDAIAPQAPALNRLMANGAIAGIEKPTLLMSGRRDQTTTHRFEATPAWEQMDGATDKWVDFQNAGHFSFISICYDLPAALIDQFQPNNAEDGCGEDFTPAEEVVTASNAYLFAFASQHVLGDDSYAEFLTQSAGDLILVEKE